MKRNPKQEGSPLFDCIPQVGPCPNNCNQCYYNRPGAFYLPIDKAHFPTLEEVGDGIVRVNSGHDSNIDYDHVIRSTAHYPKRFFNTAIPILDFPDPVVFTANRKEEELPFLPEHLNRQVEHFKKLMFIRLRVSSTNLHYVAIATTLWGSIDVPIVLTFMRYYEEEVFKQQSIEHYELRKSIKNEYYCPTPFFVEEVTRTLRHLDCEIKVCEGYCRDCLNCEHYYHQAKRRMDER